MPDAPLVIPTRFRVGLSLKGLFLVAFGGLFAALVVRALSADVALVVRGVAAVLFGVPALFLVSVSRLALADAVLGEAVRIGGAEALASRKAGYSLKLPSGGFAEYLLYNPWPPLTAGHRYTVLVGRRSRVLVEPPRADVQPG